MFFFISFYFIFGSKNKDVFEVKVYSVRVSCFEMFITLS